MDHTTADSPFGHLLATNVCPTDAELDAVRASLVHPVQRVFSLDAEIRDLETALHKLRVEKGCLQSYIDTHKIIFSPARRIPPEILATIFTHTLPHDRFPTRSSKESPLLLGRVCSLWRAVSLSTPELWNQLHIVIPSSADSGLLCKVLSNRAKYVETWLSRSGAPPISFSIYSYSWTQHAPAQNDRATMTAIIHNMMSSLLRLSKRWKRVDLRAPGIIYKLLREAITSLTVEDIPLLESLNVEFSTWGITDITESQYFNGILQAPFLHSVSFRGKCSKVSGMRLGWENIQHLQLSAKFNDRFMSIPEVQTVLAQCPKLLSCDIGVLVSNVNVSAMTPASPPSVVALPHLKHLQLCLTCHDVVLSSLVSPFFQALHLPALSSLSVTFEGKYTPFTSLPFLSLLPPGHNVQSLKLGLSSLTLEALFKVLESCPDLRALEIEQPPPSFRGRVEETLGEGLIRRLTVPEYPQNGSWRNEAGTESRMLCPALEQLHLSNLDAKDELLLAFAKSRVNTRTNALTWGSMPVVSLKAFHARLPRYKQLFDVSARTEMLRKESGLDIQLVHSTEGKDSAGEGQAV